MAFYQEMPWHEGEITIKKVIGAPQSDNPTVPALSPQLSNHLQIAPLIAIGTLDSDGRPWTTLWGGDPGIARPLTHRIVGIRTPVTSHHDPVVEELVGKTPTGEIVREKGKGRMIGGLTIDVEARKRVKFFGRMIAGALSEREDEITEQRQHVAEIQLVVGVEQSLGNCPKYLNKKHIKSAESAPSLVSDSPQLPQRALELLGKADLFFISSSQHNVDMDTNNRGGPAGFVRVVSNEPSGAVICYPEYSGNRLYQTLGNLHLNPQAGICVPDFEMGDMLYLTGRTETLIGEAAASLLPRSNLAVKIKVTAARFVATALPFRGNAGEPSPYNPLVRHLASEEGGTSQQEMELVQATLLGQMPLTPTVSRFKFSLENAATFKPGQYVTLDFSSHLDLGYSHMRDDDPRSLNDDFVRTFTVSSPSGSLPNPMRRLKDDEFEITIRKVGVVTDFLFKHHGKEKGARQQLEVGVKGFGGEFEVKQEGDESVCYIATGVGITPLLPSLHTLDLAQLELLWSIRSDDVGLVLDVLNQHPTLARSMSVFIPKPAESDSEGLDAIRKHGIAIDTRRLGKSDMRLARDAHKVYLCTATPLRKQLIEWLPGKELVFEDFNF